MERFPERSGGSRSTGAGRTRDNPSPEKVPGPDVSHRKADHVKVVLGRDVEGRYRYWEDIHLVHRALPEVDFEEVDTSSELLGHRLAAPIVITGMTGGYPEAATINDNLAHAAADVGSRWGSGASGRRS